MTTIRASRDEIQRLEALILETEEAASDEARKDNLPFANRLIGRAERYRRDLGEAMTKLARRQAIEDANT